MSVELESKNRISNLISAANAKTGGSDTDLTTAVGSLIAGFGQGGSGGGTSGIYMAKITPAEDISSFNVVHNLGTTDILLACAWAETLGDVALTADKVMMRTWLKTDIPVRLSSSSIHSNIDICNYYSASNSYIGVPTQPTSTAYLSVVVDENTFYLFGGTSASSKFAAGVTYTVIIVAASAFVGV